MLAHVQMHRLRAAWPLGNAAARQRALLLPCGAATSQAESLRLPTDVRQMVEQAAESVQRAFQAGHNRQICTCLNPVNEKANNFTSTEAMDYPCSNMKEFETLVQVTRQLLTAIIGGTPTMQLKRVDEGGLDGDLCAVLTATGDGGQQKITAVIWPTAEKLKLLKQLAEKPTTGLLLIVNPLWKTEGNLVSEFGIGPWRKANEEFVGSFEASYQLVEQRIGAPSSVDIASGTRYASGAVLRVLRAYPSPFQVFVCAADGANQPIGTFPAQGRLQRPSYQQLEALVDQARKAKLEIFQVARSASSLDLERGPPPVWQTSTADDSSTSSSADAGRSFYSSAEIEAMSQDPKAVRRVLIGLGLPGSGSPAKLKQRALAVAAAVEAGQSLQEAVAAAAKLR